jgi:hypothetical protein
MTHGGGKMGRAVFSWSALLVISFFAWLSWAEDFSADMIVTSGSNVSEGKIFVAKDKVRIEAPGSVLITRMDTRLTWVLMPEQKMYLEQPFNPKDMIGASDKIPGEVERKLIGPDTVDGKAANKYRVVYVDTEGGGQSVVLQWITTDSNIPVKTVAEDESWAMEYRNVKMGAQGGSLFEIPSGYQKFSGKFPSLPAEAGSQEAQTE